jgi:hypothetical protein
MRSLWPLQARSTLLVLVFALGCSDANKSRDSGGPDVSGSSRDGVFCDGEVFDGEVFSGGLVDGATAELDGRGATVEDAPTPVQMDVAECYPGQVSDCTWTSTYDPCRYTRCMGYSTFCSNGRWQAVQCDLVVIDAGHLLSADTAVDRFALDLGRAASPVDGMPGLDGT